MRFMPVRSSYQVTDLSSVWVVADLFEQDIGLVPRQGRSARHHDVPTRTRSSTAHHLHLPDDEKAETRSIPAVRIELANPGHRLKPAMFAQVDLTSGRQGSRCSRCQTRRSSTPARGRIVLVQIGEGGSSPREVEQVAVASTHVEVLKGVPRRTRWSWRRT